MAKLICLIILLVAFALNALALPSTNPYPLRNMELLFVAQDKEYYISIGTADLDTAKSTCSQLSKKGPPLSLLAIEDEKEYTKILWHLMKVGNVQGIWTSGYFSNANKTYAWTSTSKTMSYTNFGSQVGLVSAIAAGKPEALRRRREPNNTCILECLASAVSGPRLPRATEVFINPSKKCGTALCEAEPCEPLDIKECNVTRKNCTVTCTPPCKIVRPPCSVKCDDCKVETPPCVATPGNCTVQTEECTSVRPKCNVTTPECKVTPRNCTAKPQPCYPTTPPPCTLPNTTAPPCFPVVCKDTPPPCTTTQAPCKHDPKIMCVKKECQKASTTTCKLNHCPPPVFCQSPAIICPTPIIVCQPPETICLSPNVTCPEPENITCPEPQVHCENATYYCPPPNITCPSPVVTCPSPVVVCDPPDLECHGPEVHCPDIIPNCPPAKNCTFAPSCTTTTPIPDPDPTTTTMPTTSVTTTRLPCTEKCKVNLNLNVNVNVNLDMKGENGLQSDEPSPTAAAALDMPSGWIILNSKYNFKWDIEPSAKKAYHFICEGST